ncbi:MAG: formamidopyrimidine-DNA glycosylase [Paenibacillus sp.]|nr:formamidopyrimidine-DNA glycosylase [Paenibacillus sp.]
MPELPEMETYKTLLNQHIVHKRITGVQIEREKSINVPADDFRRQVEGQSITNVSRRAKHLLFHLDSGGCLLLHLMLGGWMFYGTERDKPDRTAQVILTFGERSLYFIGLRLGYLHLMSGAELEQKLAGLGPEPLAPDFTESRFVQLLSRKRAVLKPTMTDQKTMAGIGNCYADEICFDARIKPNRHIGTLSDEDFAALYRSMNKVLHEAIRYGGYMENPLFSGDALTGGFDSRCAVYDRGGEPCVRCGSPLIQEELASRKVFYCAVCQR